MAFIPSSGSSSLPSAAWPNRQPKFGNRLDAGPSKPLPFDPLHKQGGDQSELKRISGAQPDSGAKPENSTDAPENNPPRKPRLFGDTARMTTGFLLEDVVPPLLGFAFVAGPVGWAITLGSLPLSYLSGKLGRRIASGVEHQNLPAGLKSFQEFRESFRNRDKLQDGGQLLAKWNQFVDDALNIRSGQYKMIGGMLSNYLRLTPNSKIGKILTSKRFLKANIYHDVAQANSAGGAIKAGAKGGMSFWFYNNFLPAAGGAMEKAADVMWGPFKWPFKGMGWILHNLPFLQLGKDLMFSSPAASKK